MLCGGMQRPPSKERDTEQPNLQELAAASSSQQKQTQKSGFGALLFLQDLRRTTTKKGKILGADCNRITMQNGQSGALVLWVQGGKERTRGSGRAAFRRKNC